MHWCHQDHALTRMLEFNSFHFWHCHSGFDDFDDAGNWGKFSLNSEFCFGWQQKAYPEQAQWWQSDAILLQWFKWQLSVALLRAEVLSSIDSNNNSPLLFCVPKLCLESTQRTMVRCSFVCQCYVFNRLNDKQSDVAIASMMWILERTNCFVRQNDNSEMLFCVWKFCLQSIQRTIVRCSSVCRSSVLNRLKGQ